MSFGSPRPSGLTVVACFARSVHAAPFALGRKQAAARSDSVQKLFDRSQWREGFDDACKTLENTARKYFQTGCDRGRIKLIRKGKTVVPSRAAIRKLSLGGLATAFSEIQGQNYTDAIVGKTLNRINPDRV